MVDAECTSLTVPEDRGAGRDAKGRTLDLAIAVVKATGRKTAPDPLFFLAGGPGQSAQDAYPGVAGSFARVNLMHDIVLVDQRGTGRSHPLGCPETELETTTVDRAKVVELAERCRMNLAAHADLRQYTTAIAMDDLDEVRERLGYDKIDLYGGSYGTRAALVYMRRHPSHVRSVILDGVAPPDWTIGGTLGKDAQRTMDLISARCAADPDCNRAFPDLPGSLTTLLDKVTTPQTVTVTHPISAAPTTVTVSRESVGSTLRALSYESETIALLPLLIHSAAATGDLHPLAAQSLILSDFMKISQGEHLAVTCSEDAPFLDPAQLEKDNGASYVGTGSGLLYVDACKTWPRANVTAEDRAPVSSNAPVLLLSGELDPVTPPSNAAWAARTLPNSFQITVPGEGHNALQRSCTRRIIEDFVEHASVAGLSADCLKDAKPMRFFTSFAGPQP